MRVDLILKRLLTTMLCFPAVSSMLGVGNNSSSIFASLGNAIAFMKERSGGDDYAESGGNDSGNGKSLNDPILRSLMQALDFTRSAEVALMESGSDTSLDDQRASLLCDLIRLRSSSIIPILLTVEDHYAFCLSVLCCHLLCVRALSDDISSAVEVNASKLQAKLGEPWALLQVQLDEALASVTALRTLLCMAARTGQPLRGSAVMQKSLHPSIPLCGHGKTEGTARHRRSCGCISGSTRRTSGAIATAADLHAGGRDASGQDVERGRPGSEWCVHKGSQFVNRAYRPPLCSGTAGAVGRGGRRAPTRAAQELRITRSLAHDHRRRLLLRCGRSSGRRHRALLSQGSASLSVAAGPEGSQCRGERFGLFAAENMGDFH